MSEPSDPNVERNALRDQIIGLGSRSVRKSYYPQLQQEIDELGKAKAALEEKSESLLRTLKDLEAARQRAEENERKFRSLFEGITDGVVVADPDTRRLKQVNPAFCQMLGYTEAELLQLSISDIHPPEEPLRLTERLSTIRYGISVLMENQPFKRKDGSIVYTDINATAVDLENRHCVLGVCRDITERKQAEEQLRERDELMRYVIQHDPNAITVLDNDLRHLFVSDRFLQDYNLKECDVIGKYFYDVVPEMPEKWKAVHRRCLAGAVEKSDDDFFARPDGSITYNRWECRPWVHSDGNIGGIIIYTEVVTERKLAEQKLQRSEADLGRAQAIAHLGSWSWDIALDQFSWSDEMYRIFGVNPAAFDSSLAGQARLIHPDDVWKHERAIRAALAGQPVESYDYRAVRPDGTERVVEINGMQLEVDQEGRARKLFGVAQDITERKQAEEALKKSEEHLHRFVEGIPVGYMRWKMDGSILDANDRFLQMLGYSHEDVQVGSLNWINMTPEEFRPLDQQAMDDMQATGRCFPFEKAFVSKQGERVPVLVSAVLVDEANYEGGAFVLDLTDRKRAEQAVVKSEQKYRELVENANSIILRWTPEGLITYLNEFGLTFFGYSEDEILGRQLPGTIVPEVESTGRNLVPLMGEIRANPQKFEHNINENIRRNGERVWIAWTNKVVLNNEGQIKEILSIGSDVTERIRAEEALEREQEFNRALVENMAEAVVACNANLELTLFNRAAREWHGMDARMVPPEQWGEFYHLFCADGVTPLTKDNVPLLRAFRDEAMQDEPMVICAKGQPPRHVLANCIPFFDEQGRKLGAVAVMHDITQRKEAEEALKREQVFTNAVIDSVPGLLYLYDSEGHLIRWNKQHEKITGYTSEELAQIHILDWYRGNEEDTAVIARGVEQCLAEGYAEADANLQTKNGAKILFHLTAVHLEIDGKGYFAGIGIDITERKRAENELHRLNRLYAVLSQVNEAVIHSASQQELLEQVCRISIESGAFKMAWVGKVNPETHQVLPVAAAGTHRGFLDKVSVYADDRPEGRGTVGISIREERTFVSNDFLGFPGTRPWRELAATFGFRAIVSLPLRNAGKIYGALVVYADEVNCFRDKEVKLLEEVASDVSFALDRFDQEMQRQQDEVALKQAKEAAETANRAKDQFIAVLSHELRTPLTPVLTAVALLQSHEKMSEEIGEEIDIIHRNVELEAKLIDDLLDVTRISRGIVELRHEDVDVHACLVKTLEICRSGIAEKGIEVSLSLRAKNYHVWADSARLHQVFWNLLKNAVKFTPEEGRISIRTTNIDKRLRIEVADTGIGIEPDVLPRIFNAFEQGEKTWTRRFGGLGLGLSIAKAIVELHKGSLSASSEGQNKGSVFTVELETMVSAPGTAISSVAASPQKDGQRKILLVEDNADTLRILSRLFQKWGYSVHCSDCVAKAMDLAARESFDILISDIGLPDGSGLDIMRQTKERYGLRGIALSGFGTDDDRRQSRAAGFEEHLTKPVGIEGLRAAIERILSESIS